MAAINDPRYILISFNTTSGARGIKTTKLFTVREFFKRITNPETRAYTVSLNSGESPQLITRRRLLEEFSQYSDKPYFINKMQVESNNGKGS